MTRRIVPLYRVTRALEIQGAGMVEYRSVTRNSDPVAQSFEIQGAGMVSYRFESEVLRYEVQGAGMVQYKRSFVTMKIMGGASIETARSIAWDEITFERWKNMTFFQWQRIFPPNL